MRRVDTAAELGKLETCIKLVEGIRYFEAMISHATVSMQGIQGRFPDMMSRLRHKSEVYEKCVQRLEERYKKVVAGLYS